LLTEEQERRQTQAEYNTMVKKLIARLNNFYKDPMMVLNFSMSQALYYGFQIQDDAMAREYKGVY